LHQVGDLFEVNVKLRCQKVKITPTFFGVNTPSSESLQVVLVKVMNY